MLWSKDLGAFRCLSYLKPQLESISPSLHEGVQHFKAGGPYVRLTLPSLPSFPDPENSLPQIQTGDFELSKVRVRRRGGEVGGDRRLEWVHFLGQLSQGRERVAVLAGGP